MGVVQIQVIEGGIERIQINGLSRLREGYIRDRITFGHRLSPQVDRLQDAIRLLQIDPLLERINAELTAGSRPGQNILIVDVVEADPFTMAFTVNNSRAPSIGSVQGGSPGISRKCTGFWVTLPACDMSLLKG